MSTESKKSTSTGKSIEALKPQYISSELAELLELGKIFVDTGLLPQGIDTPQKAFLLMQQGKELGLAPMQSINNIAVINGKTSISASMMRSLILKSGVVTFKLQKHDDKICEYVFFRSGVEMPPVSFTIEEAEKAGLTNGINWKRYPKDMLSARAFARGARLYCSDIIQGMYTQEEMQDEVEFVSKGRVENLHIRDTINEVFDSLKTKIETATNMRDLEGYGKQIRKNQELGLISSDSLTELAQLFTKRKAELEPKVVEAEIVKETPEVTPETPAETSPEASGESKEIEKTEEPSQEETPKEEVKEEAKTDIEDKPQEVAVETPAPEAPVVEPDAVVVNTEEQKGEN